MTSMATLTAIIINHYKDFKDYSDYNDYNDYYDHKDNNLDVDLDWELQ